MSTSIKITNNGTFSLTGTKVLVGGFAIPQVSNIKFSHPVGDVARLELEIIAVEEFEIEMPAEVTFKIVAYPGYEIQGEETGQRKVYRAVRLEDRK